MRLFDLHCDTLSEIYAKKEGLYGNSCHIGLDKVFSVFDEYCQVTAVWSEHDLTEDENYRKCLDILDYAEPLIGNVDGFTPILAVEGAKLLNGDLGRLDVLAERGVRILTLVWKGISCIGGAYDNDDGLTDFGKDVVLKCFELGITPDLSHSNDKISREAVILSKAYDRPIIASHSCSRAVFDYPRNISDEIAKEIAEVGGAVGVNFVPEHLGEGKTDIIVQHIEHLADVMGAQAVCLGGDFDGTSNLPDEIKNVGDLPVLFDAISKKYHSEDFAEAVFYTNARNFANDYLFL